MSSGSPPDGPDHPLSAYRSRRNFARTPEPAGGGDGDGAAPSAGGDRRFVVQKHQARRLHYDFRLAWGGVLKSWAVPNGPSLDPADRRLAVAVEDHPLTYLDFEGVIPAGEYGGGTVMVWDHGTWEPLGDPERDLARGRLAFLLFGTRLTGRWLLVRLGDRPDTKAGRDWLLIKGHDPAARPGDADRLLTENSVSALSGRDLAAIAADRDRVWRPVAPDPPAPAPPSPSLPDRVPANPATVSGARPGVLPPFVAPALASPTPRPPAGPSWLHEIKFDGYRLQCRIDQGKVQFLTRNGHDWTDKFPALVTAAKALPARAALLDGEVVVRQPTGVTSFQALQDALGAGRNHLLSFYAFDLLHLDGFDLSDCPLIARKALLAQCLAGLGEDGPILLSEYVEGHGPEFIRAACRLALEGAISKRRDSPYRSGRGHDWLKVKCIERQEFVIGGFTRPSTGSSSAGPGGGIGALLVGTYDEHGTLIYAGRVGTGFRQAEADRLRRRLESLRRPDPPFGAPIDRAEKGVTWVTPALVCEVEFLDWTADGKLRHPAYKGLREDKSPATVRRERPTPAPGPTAGVESDRMAEPIVAGVRLTHPDRVLYPGTGLTKRGLAHYYTLVAPRILPHLAGRPLSLVRCPNGQDQPCFFQRHHSDGLPAPLRPLPPALDGDDKPLMFIEDLGGLIALVQLGVLEIHPWGSRIEAIDRPDRLIFDLDPDPTLPFERVADAARDLRERLQQCGLRSFVQLTGGKGLHVVVPLTPRAGWAEVKGFAHALARRMAADQPRRYVATMAKEARTGRLYIDYLRNDRGATAIAPYSTRARPGAPVAVPLAWTELVDIAVAAPFTVETLPRRLQHLADDPWAGLADTDQTLPDA